MVWSLKQSFDASRLLVFRFQISADRSTIESSSSALHLIHIPLNRFIIITITNYGIGLLLTIIYSSLHTIFYINFVPFPSSTSSYPTLSLKRFVQTPTGVSVEFRTICPMLLSSTIAFVCYWTSPRSHWTR